MRIGSILIDAIERVSVTLVKDFEIVTETGGNFGTARLSVLYNPATIGAGLPTPGDLVEIFTSGGVGGDPNQLWGQPLFGDPLFGESVSTTALFRGEIVSVEPRVLVMEDISTAPVNLVVIEARDWGSILDAAQVLAADYTAQNDNFIIADSFGTYAPTINLTNVAMTTTLATFERHDESLRAVMDRLRERTGAMMYIGPDKDLHWFLPTARPAPFSFSDTPNMIASFPFDRESFRVLREWRTPANSVTVLGQVGSGGVRIRRTITNATSIATYGTKGRTIVDPQITSNAEADLRAQVEVDKDGVPEYSGTLVTRLEGLTVGMLLTITCTTSLNFSGNFVIRRITQRWVNRTITESEIEWGAYRPDTAALLRAIAEAAKQLGAVVPGVPGPGTVNNGAIIPGSVTGGTGGSMASATITQLNVGNAAIGTAQIRDLEVTNGKIANLGAEKITTGDLEIGGSGKIGQARFYDAGNAVFAWAGKSGAEYGIWTTTLWVGGFGPTSAKIKAEASGAITIALADGDSMELISSTNSLRARLNPSGLAVLNSSAANGSVIDVDSMTITNSSSSTTVSEVFGGSAAVRVIGGGTNEISIASNGAATGLYIGGLVIVKTRQTGWTAATGTNSRGGFATSTVTLAEVASNVKSLIDDLMTHGLIG